MYVCRPARASMHAFVCVLPFKCALFALNGQLGIHQMTTAMFISFFSRFASSSIMMLDIFYF